MANILTGLWNLITPPNLIAGTIVVSVYTWLFGKQTRYIVALLPHPMHLLHGHWVCPACFGKGTAGRHWERPGEAPCLVCLPRRHFVLYDKQVLTPAESDIPAGYVVWHVLWHEWDKRHWQSRR